ncbi:hypothetical protein A3L04_06380 [Thermococcus chitonophagus]|uniref:DUF4145 domain-containing protein n=1 Tax=Thermococcus chitonophagus TaxID=54262 RepID=A0A160VWC1_9EURY|nr:DUF4145 domain-containing protein [Thermococcus chitonophagus]ASJ16724.1 hypothetical protein A3L04_06380 [Thermococcus chitonophagus]CUX78191.1 hypothetical protein CHITON_1412 [Thermococcus chitonophagus]
MGSIAAKEYMVKAKPYDHFEIVVSIRPQGGGLNISVGFYNHPLKPGPTPNIEIWYPIVGYVGYRDRSNLFTIGHLYHFSRDISLHSVGRVFQGLLRPGDPPIEIEFFVKVPLEHAEKMKEIADKRGVLSLIVALQFSALYDQGKIGQRTMNYEINLPFEIPRESIEEWVAYWTGIYAYYVELPKTTPEEVFHDYVEAIKAYNVGAYRASVAMARRALQQALIDKGASKKKTLHQQIEELFERGLLDKATKSLADSVRYFGNYGAHPQDDMLAQVTKEDAKLVLDVLRKILCILYQAKDK